MVKFSFKFVLVRVKGGELFGRPKLVAVEVVALVDGKVLSPHVWCIPTPGEFLHPLGSAWWVHLHLSPGFFADSGVPFCSYSVTVGYSPRRPS